MVVVVFFSSVVAAGGGLMMVVLFSTFFSSFAGGLTIVVFFSTTGGGTFTRASQATRTKAAVTGIRSDFMFYVLCRDVAGVPRPQRPGAPARSSAIDDYFFSVVVVVVVVFFSSITGAAGTITAFLTMTLEAIILPPVFT